MKLITSLSEMQKYVNDLRAQGKTIGFVPTMGFLHEGHLSLMRQARAENDIVIISIFVNPTQFGPQEDYDAYPRDLTRDCNLVMEISVDAVFAPSVREMYREGYNTFVEVEGTLTQRLCGASRPGHFRGVTTVVAKLFNLVKPHRAYFGQKDAQQLIVIQRMVNDLNFAIEIVPMPTIREHDGLAMSSRNKNLNKEERQSALVLYKSLNLAMDMINTGERDAAKIRTKMQRLIETEKKAKIDYISLVDAHTLEELTTLTGEILIALAVFIGNTRLIDNVRLMIDD
ncbi:pantoate--beta-alanine ligase [Candidatus Poribacteria bacterium]|nr:pantoate--beta-alanine ligase [Candidatus Poribacteria bacterium]